MTGQPGKASNQYLAFQKAVCTLVVLWSSTVLLACMTLGAQGPSGDSVQPGSAEFSTGKSPPNPRDALPSEISLLWLPPPFQDPDRRPDQPCFPTDDQYSPAGLIGDSKGKDTKGKLSIYLCFIPNGSNSMI